jgi:FtsP/CotA-like multicopper oxidase with cupredoxin domain
VAPGQKVSVNVINLLPKEATTVHWHGMMHRDTPYADGVPGATQCAISNLAGHNTMTYAFTVPPTAGTFWVGGSRES